MFYSLFVWKNHLLYRVFVLLLCRSCILSASFLAAYIVWLTTAQPTFIEDDNYYDLRREAMCGCHIDHLQTQLSQVQKELQQQRQQIEELTKAVNQSSKSDIPG